MRHLTTCLALAFASATVLQAQPASFQRLGILGTAPNGTTSSTANAVSSDGSVVVGLTSSGARNQEAFRWTATDGMTPLGGFTAPAFANRAEGVSASGLVVGLGLLTPSGFGQVFVWRDTSARFPSFPGENSGWARDVSDTDVIVGLISGRIEQAFTRRDTVITRLGVIEGGPFRSSAANGVSADGLVVVGRSRGASGWEAFRWTAGGGMVGIGDLPGGAFDGEAFAASADGQVVVGLSNGEFDRTQAFRWTLGGGMRGLGFLRGGSSSLAYGVSGDGSVVVGSAGNASNQSVAMVWTADDGMQAVQARLEARGVDLAGWTLRSAEDVSADGTVLVGTGTNPAGQFEAWRAVLPRTTTAAEPAPDAASARLSVSGNPLTAGSAIHVNLPAPGPVRLTVSDALGRVVARLADGVWPAGARTFPFDGRGLASGVYVVCLDAAGTRVTRTMQVVR